MLRATWLTALILTACSGGQRPDPDDPVAQRKYCDKYEGHADDCRREPTCVVGGPKKSCDRNKICTQGGPATCLPCVDAVGLYPGVTPAYCAERAASRP